MRALANATEIRRCNAVTLRRIRALPRRKGYIETARTIAKFEDPHMGAIRLGNLLKSIDHVGDRQATKLIDAARIQRKREILPLRDLSERERLDLARVLYAHGGQNGARPYG
jgi:hypothetical protein